MIKQFLPFTLGFALLGTPAFAAKAAHHCVDNNRNQISVTAAPGKTLSAQCKAAGGKWVKAKASSIKPTTTSSTPTTAAPPTK